MIHLVRKHRQKKIVMLSGFWPLRGWGGLRETVKKGKFVTKTFSADNFEWSSNNLWKMMSANAKANAKQQEVKDLVVYILQMFIRGTFKTWIIKRGCIFHSILVGIPFILILSVKNRGRGGLLNGQNPLSVTKVICRQSLNVSKVSRCFGRNSYLDIDIPRRK